MHTSNMTTHLILLPHPPLHVLFAKIYMLQNKLLDARRLFRPIERINMYQWNSKQRFRFASLHCMFDFSPASCLQTVLCCKKNVSSMFYFWSIESQSIYYWNFKRRSSTQSWPQAHICWAAPSQSYLLSSLRRQIAASSLGMSSIKRGVSRSPLAGSGMYF